MHMHFINKQIHAAKYLCFTYCFRCVADIRSGNTLQIDRLGCLYGMLVCLKGIYIYIFIFYFAPLVLYIELY